jgi:hypothetical protein
VEEGAKIQTKGTGNLLNKIREEISQLYVTTETPKIRRHFKFQIDMTRKEQFHFI